MCEQCELHWQRENGVYQKQFDNVTIIKSFYLQNNDIWNADIYPSDGYEYGSRTTVPHVIISNTAVIVSDINVLPKNPTPDDILKANYLVGDELEQSNVFIRWYVNDFLISDFNDQQYVKLPVVEDDKVRFEVRHIDGTSYVSSPIVSIVASNFVIS